MTKLSKLMVSLLTASALTTTAFAADTTTAAQPTTQAQPSSAQVMQDASYIIGYTIAKNMMGQLQAQGITLDTQNLETGFTTGVSGEQPRLTEEQMQQSMQQFQTLVQQQQAQVQQPPAQPSNNQNAN